MKSLIKILVCLLMSLNTSFAQSSTSSRMIIGIEYFKEMMGNVHQNPDRYSQVLTTISCNYPVKIIEEKDAKTKKAAEITYDPKIWSLVRVGPYEGYILKNYLSSTKNVCFEEEYSKFFDGLELDINDLYYWARLYDQFVQEKTQVTK